MTYQLFRLNFQTGVHLGEGFLGTSSFTFSADRLFSALCHVAGDDIDEFILRVRQEKIRFSDSFPFIEDVLYLPKPVLILEQTKELNFTESKKMKAMDYIQMDQLEPYLKGEYTHTETSFDYSKLGVTESRTRIATNPNDDPLPYQVGITHFYKNAGLYIILASESDDDSEFFEMLLYRLAVQGIGGKVSSGLGKFEFDLQLESFSIEPRLNSGDKSRVMTLSLCLPQNHEIEEALEDSHYKIFKRSGFASSESSMNKKKNIFMLAAGSTFQHRFKGDLYDVSNGADHPVYRYAYPMFVRLFNE